MLLIVSRFCISIYLCRPTKKWCKYRPDFTPFVSKMINGVKKPHFYTELQSHARKISLTRQRRRNTCKITCRECDVKIIASCICIYIKHFAAELQPLAFPGSQCLGNDFISGNTTGRNHATLIADISLDLELPAPHGIDQRLDFH